MHLRLIFLKRMHAQRLVPARNNPVAGAFIALLIGVNSGTRKAVVCGSLIDLPGHRLRLPLKHLSINAYAWGYFDAQLTTYPEGL